MTHALDRAEPSQRIHDINGWFEVKRNPLSKVGIFDYSGAQIGAPPEDAHKIFRVYRPAEELARAEAVESFKLAPFIDDHTMLGEGFTPAEHKGVEGVIGQDVVFEGDTLFGNVKVYSKGLAEKIKNGKTEVSCGYRCRYDFTPGVWNGEPYDVVQRDIRGNHVALVDEGRMGPEVAILDHLTFAVDAKELDPVDPKLEEMLAAIMARLDKLEAAKPAAADKETEEPVEDTEVEEPVADAEFEEGAGDVDVTEKAGEVAELAGDLQEIAEELVPADAKLKGRIKGIAAKLTAGAAKIKTKAAMDSKERSKLAGRLKALEDKPAMDEATVVNALAKRDDLANRLSTHIGTFDHSKMTHAEVAKYGVEKLAISGVVAGQEAVALDAFLQAKPKPTERTSVAQDAGNTALAQRIANHGHKE